MVVGILFLVVATFTVGRIHGGMTFVFVVVGVAITLYGTGTQATGSLDGTAPSTTFKLSLAGGAGALAFAAAAGIVFYQDGINRAFREEARLLEVTIPVKLAGSVYLQNYVIGAAIDAEPVPAMALGSNNIVLFVPYKLTDKVKHLTLRASWADLTKIPDAMKPIVTIDPIDFDVSSRDVSGGQELPKERLPELPSKYFFKTLQEISTTPETISAALASPGNTQPMLPLIIQADQP
jgi:hypothetical protein